MQFEIINGKPVLKENFKNKIGKSCCFKEFN
jgi:hypothetical protein